jgi:hypothetical protein
VRGFSRLGSSTHGRRGSVAPGENSRKLLGSRGHNDRMNRALSLALLILGCVLIIYGISASQSFSSDVSRFFTGNPTDKTMWLLIGGIVAAVLGIGGMLRGGTHT